MCPVLVASLVRKTTSLEGLTQEAFGQLFRAWKESNASLQHVKCVRVAARRLHLNLVAELSKQSNCSVLQMFPAKSVVKSALKATLRQNKEKTWPVFRCTVNSSDGIDNGEVFAALRLLGALSKHFGT